VELEKQTLAYVPTQQWRNCHDTRCVTRTAVAMERLGKRVCAETSSRAVFSVRSGLRRYEKDKQDRLSQSSFETPVCQDISLGAEELN
jgi:hypothetical protein